MEYENEKMRMSDKRTREWKNEMMSERNEEMVIEKRKKNDISHFHLCENIDSYLREKIG